MLAWVLVFRVTYSIVDFTHFEIDLGGVAVDIYIERAGLYNLSFLYMYFSEDYLFFVFLLVLHFVVVPFRILVFSKVSCGIN